MHISPRVNENFFVRQVLRLLGWKNLFEGLANQNPIWQSPRYTIWVYSQLANREV